MKMTGQSVLKSQARIRAIDGLRAWLAIEVALCHLVGSVQSTPTGSLLETWFREGYWATRPFFLISGFLVSASWKSTEEPRLRNFAIKRFFRIVPLWWGLLIWLSVTEKISLQAFFVYASFLYGFIPKLPIVAELVHAWSLFVEECFYWTFPLIFATQLRKPMVLAGLAVAFTALGTLWLNLGHHLLASDPADFLHRSVLGQYQFFALGVFLHWLAEQPGFFQTLAAFSGRFKLGNLDLLVLFFGVFAAFSSVVPFEIRAIVFFFAVLCPNGFFASIFSHPFFAWVGRRCYSIYLTHVLVMRLLPGWRLLPDWARHAASWNVRYFSLALVQIPICVGVAAIIYEVIEKPGIALGRGLIRQFRSRDFSFRSTKRRQLSS